LNRWSDGHLTIYRTRRAQAASGGATPAPAPSGLAAANESGALAAVREITNSGLPDDLVGSLFQDDRGRIWVSTLSGVAYFENGRFTAVSAVPAGADVYSIADDGAGNLWISDSNGLLHVLQGSAVERIPWARLGRKDAAFSLVPDPVQGGLWLGFFKGGVACFKDGQVRASYAGADGLGEGRVSDLKLDSDGTLWAATEGGLSRVKNGRVATLTSKNGLPCDAGDWVVEDDAHSFWLYTACGLVRIARPELDAWIATVDKDPKRRIQATVFDSSDGVRNHPTTSRNSPRGAKSADGKLWFLPRIGVSVVDPRHLPVNTLPPPVHIEHVTADRQTYAASSHLRLPPLVRDLEIDYTALSFVAPEKVLFRYKLEGLDRDWQDVGNRRQAFYNNLSPGNYRFRVMACNNSGVWNEAGAFVDFSIEPAYYQTTWFRAIVAASLLFSLWCLYQIRVRSIEQRYRERKLAAEKLQRIEGYLSEAQRLSRTGSFGWSPSSGEMYWSDETYRMVGFDRATKPTFERVLQRVHPDDRAFVQQTLDSALRNRTDVDYEHRFLLSRTIAWSPETSSTS